MIRPLIRVCVIALILIACPVHAAEINYDKSWVKTDKEQVTADGIDSARISARLISSYSIGIEGVSVTLQSSRGSADEIEIERDVTNSGGYAYFRVRSLRAGTSEFTLRVDDMTVTDTATVEFTGGLDLVLAPGTLIKIPDDGNLSTQSDSAVYYYAKDGRRYVFPNEKTYFTWYPDFRNVQTISLEDMSLIPIGGNVTHKPGVRLLKFQTDVKTYAVAEGGVLRWLTSEETARKFYGDDWAALVDDVPESFYVNYVFGDPIESVTFYTAQNERTNTQTIDDDKGL